MRPSVRVPIEGSRFCSTTYPASGRISAATTRDRLAAWRRGFGAFKAHASAPLARNLAPGGRLLAIHPCRDAGLGSAAPVARRDPFHALFTTSCSAADVARARRAQLPLAARPDDKAVFRYHMHTLPSEILIASHVHACSRPGTPRSREPDRGLTPCRVAIRLPRATQAVLQSTGLCSPTKPSSSPIGFREGRAGVRFPRDCRCSDADRALIVDLRCSASVRVGRHAAGFGARLRTSPVTFVMCRTPEATIVRRTTARCGRKRLRVPSYRRPPRPTGGPERLANPCGLGDRLS